MTAKKTKPSATAYLGPIVVKDSEGEVMGEYDSVLSAEVDIKEEVNNGGWSNDVSYIIFAPVKRLSPNINWSVENA